MTVPVVLAIAGVIALLVGVLGGGIKAKEVEVPPVTPIIRIITSATGLVLIAAATLLSPPDAKDNNQVLFATSSFPASPQTVTPQLIPVQTAAAENTIFTLADAKSEDFYSLADATFVLRSDRSLAVTGSYAQGTYLNRSLPDNFRATVQFRTEHLEDQFILGLSNGKEMRPNYHFVMKDTGESAWIAFKQQLGFDEENWDKYVQDTGASNFLIKPDVTYEVVLERENGSINVSINNKLVFALGVQEVRDIGEFNYLYLTGADQQQLIIESLIIEKLE